MKSILRQWKHRSQGPKSCRALSRNKNAFRRKGNTFEEEMGSPLKVPMEYFFRKGGKSGNDRQ